MILKLVTFLLDLVSKIIMAVISLPVFPAEVATAVDSVLEWMVAGVGIIDFFMPLGMLTPGIVFALIMANAQTLYDLFMWVIKKIPFFGISD